MIQAAWALPILTAITCFFLEYTWPGRWFARRNLILFFLPCLLFLGLAVTDDFHHMIRIGFAYKGKTVPLRGLFRKKYLSLLFKNQTFMNHLCDNYKNRTNFIDFGYLSIYYIYINHLDNYSVGTIH